MSLEQPKATNRLMEKAARKPEMIILMGLQASGKSTFFEQRFKVKDYAHINLDTLRTRHQEHLRLFDCVSNKLDCVIDNTNPTRTDRERYIKLAREYDYHIVGYFMQSKLSACLERNSQRERQVPKKGILATFNKIEMPSLEEGFDELNFVSIEDGVFKTSKWIEDEI